MLNDLDERCRVKAGEPGVSIDQRPMNEVYPPPLHGCEPLEPQAFCCELQSPVRDVHSDDFIELALLHQEPQQSALTATEVKNPFCATALGCFGDSRESLFIQGEGLLERILFGVPNRGSRYAISLRGFLRQQAANRFPNEIATVLQISSDDRVALRMHFEPALSM